MLAQRREPGRPVERRDDESDRLAAGDDASRTAADGPAAEPRRPRPASPGAPSVRPAAASHPPGASAARERRAFEQPRSRRMRAARASAGGGSKRRVRDHAAVAQKDHDGRVGRAPNCSRTYCSRSSAGSASSAVDTSEATSAARRCGDPSGARLPRIGQPDEQHRLRDQQSGHARDEAEADAPIQARYHTWSGIGGLVADPQTVRTSAGSAGSFSIFRRMRLTSVSTLRSLTNVSPFQTRASSASRLKTMPG